MSKKKRNQIKKKQTKSGHFNKSSKQIGKKVISKKDKHVIKRKKRINIKFLKKISKKSNKIDTKIEENLSTTIKNKNIKSINNKEQNNNIQLISNLNNLQQNANVNVLNNNINSNQIGINIFYETNNYFITRNIEQRSNSLFTPEFDFKNIQTIRTNYSSDDIYINDVHSEQAETINESNNFIQRIFSHNSINSEMLNSEIENAELNQNRRCNIPKTKIENICQLEENRKKCIICLEDFENGQEVSYLLCSHVFHYQCLYRYSLIKPECPLCRDILLK